MSKGAKKREINVGRGLFSVKGYLKPGFGVEICSASNSTRFISPITNREVTLNFTDRTLIVLPDADYGNVNASIDKLITDWEHRRKAEHLTLPSSFMKDVGKFKTVRSSDDLLLHLKDLLTKLPDYEIYATRPRVGDLLIALWACRALSLPSEYLYNKFPDAMLRPVVWSGLEPSVFPTLRALEEISGNIWRNVLKMITRIGGVSEFGDIPPAAIRHQTIREDYKDASPLRSAAEKIRIFQLHRYGAAAERLRPQDYADIRDRVIRLDKTFDWCLLKDPNLSAMKDEARAYLESETRGHAGKVTALNAFLDFLVAHPDVCRDPKRLVIGEAMSASFPRWLREKRKLTERSENYSRYINVISSFFDFVVGRWFTDEGVRAAGTKNPIPREARRSISRTRTNRKALPTFIIRRMREIVLADDFAWPRSLKQDYFHSVDETGAVQRNWSPVRAVALLVKLHLPLRGFQVRLLNSGEADDIRYESQTETWIDNEHTLAGSHPRPMGVIRRYHDEFSGADFAGFYVNTNKTQDTDLKTGRGYEMPWNYKVVVDWLCELRVFQERYNPVWSLVRWADLHERYIKVTFSPQQLLERGGETFLFRDPCSGYPKEPVLGDRIDAFYGQLCQRAQEVLANEGVTLPDGSPIQLVHQVFPHEGSKTPFPRAIYDLHSLRVGLLTSLAIDGKVPLSILSRCVAGHATLLMTLYYHSFGVSYVNDVLTQAQMNIAEDEQGSLLRWMKEQTSLEALSERAVAVASDGLDYFLKGDSASWVIMDAGICPVGCSRCSEGGAVIQKSKGEYRRYAAVPTAPNGSPRNCARCRFFITGPCFLVGLQALFNSTSLFLQSHAEEFRDKQSKLAQFDRERHEAQTSSKPFEKHRLHQAATEAVENARETLDQTALTLHALFGLATQCKDLLAAQTSSASRKFALVVNNKHAEIEVSLEFTSDFELVNSICHSASWFASVPSEVASLKRNRILDRMLSLNGLPPVFTFLEEGEALQVGNELTKFLEARVGFSSTIKLMDSEAFLDSFGITADVRRLLPQAPSHLAHQSQARFAAQ